MICIIIINLIILIIITIIILDRGLDCVAKRDGHGVGLDILLDDTIVNGHKLFLLGCL